MQDHAGSMARYLVYFDLETKRTANAVGGWQNKHERGISVAVTFRTTSAVSTSDTEATVRVAGTNLLTGETHAEKVVVPASGVAVIREAAPR